MEGPIQSSEEEEDVLELWSEANTVRAFVDEVLPDARIQKLFSKVVEEPKLEVM